MNWVKQIYSFMYKSLNSETLYILLNLGTYILYKKFVSCFQNEESYALWLTGGHVSSPFQLQFLLTFKTSILGRVSPILCSYSTFTNFNRFSFLQVKIPIFQQFALHQHSGETLVLWKWLPTLHFQHFTH